MSSSSKFAGLRSVLSDERATGDDESTVAAPAPDHTAAEPEAPVERTTPVEPAPSNAPTRPRRAQRANTRRSTDTSPKKRSNLTLNDDLVKRIIAARDEHRWTFTRLLETALDEWTDLTDTEAGKRLAATGPRHRQQNISLAERYFEQLDDLGEQWRMNRSETVTVIVGNQLDELGL